LICHNGFAIIEKFKGEFDECRFSKSRRLTSLDPILAIWLRMEMEEKLPHHQLREESARYEALLEAETAI
jgi:hypothetical protein